jgi:uncharacterized protein with HEPN domain
VRGERVYLEYARESIDLVVEYTSVGESSLTDDVKTQDAVLRRMETLADAVSRLSDELKARHPEIPWRQISAFRNVLAHAYTEIRLDVVWNVIQRDLPALRKVVEEELSGP